MVLWLNCPLPKKQLLSMCGTITTEKDYLVEEYALYYKHKAQRETPCFVCAWCPFHLDILTGTGPRNVTDEIFFVAQTIDMILIKTFFMLYTPHLLACYHYFMTWWTLLTHWVRHKMAAILQTASSNAFYWLKTFVIWFRCHGVCF